MQNTSFFARFATGLSVLVMGCILIPLAFYSLVASSLILVPILYLIAGVFCFYIAFLISTRAPLHTVTITFIAILGTAFILGLAVLGYGVMNDVMGVRCTGFFGAQTECMSNAWLTIIVIAVIFPAAPLFIGLFAVIAWVIQYRYLLKRSTPTQ